MVKLPQSVLTESEQRDRPSYWWRKHFIAGCDADAHCGWRLPGHTLWLMYTWKDNRKKKHKRVSWSSLCLQSRSSADLLRALVDALSPRLCHPDSDTRLAVTPAHQRTWRPWKTVLLSVFFHFLACAAVTTWPLLFYVRAQDVCIHRLGEKSFLCSAWSSCSDFLVIPGSRGHTCIYRHVQKQDCSQSCVSARIWSGRRIKQKQPINTQSS